MSDNNVNIRIAGHRPVWAWAGAITFAASWLIGLSIAYGVGQQSCSFYGVECIARAVLWLLVTQTLAAILLRAGTAQLVRGTWPYRLAFAGALLSALAVLGGLAVVLFVLTR